MLKYSLAGDDNSFSPSHRAENGETTQGLIKDTLDPHSNPRTRTKMVMKKRAKHVQKRTSDFSMFPPISGPRRDVVTPYINNSTHPDLETPYTNALGISRIHDVSTPYIMNSHFSKLEAVSPLPAREYMLNGREFTKMTHGNNVVDVHSRSRNEATFTHDTLAKIQQQSTSPYIERKSSFDKRNKVLTDRFEYDRNSKLQVHSNQMGLLERRRQRGNETFSIRKKIEQFRRWHEEQYKEKLKKLKEEIDHQFEADGGSRIKKSPKHKKTSHDKHLYEHKENDAEKENHVKHEKERKLTTESPVPEEASCSTEKQPMEMLEAPGHVIDDKSTSDQSWHTWRDVNDSYAYNDVNKYIEDNELMSPEKSEWIHDWIIAVEEARQAPNEQDEDLL